MHRLAGPPELRIRESQVEEANWDDAGLLTRQLVEDDQKTPRVRLWHEGEDEGPNRLDG
ncbi:MAG: hypothetical protein K0S45_3445 [Nitrospira sp.]|nr:hypothetical protein [Nitrospira sp.]